MTFPKARHYNKPGTAVEAFGKVRTTLQQAGYRCESLREGPNLTDGRIARNILVLQRKVTHIRFD